MMKKRKDEDKKPVEQEVAELQRKFRVLENDKRAYSEDSQGIIRKQRATIEKLTRENRQMKQELSEVRRADRGGPEARRAGETLAKLAENREQLEKAIAKEFEVKQKLEEKTDVVEAKTIQVREELGLKGGVNAAKESQATVAKQIRVLENRLDKALQKFNEAVSDNKKQRDTIDSLRAERVVFDNIYSKLEKEFEQKKKEMANIIEQANAAYEARDAAQAQMTSLKQQADKEHQEFEKEWKELGRLIENDKKMKEFMRQKERNRGVEEHKGDLSADEEDKLKKKVTKNAWMIAKGKVAQSANSERISVYEEAFAKVQAATGISDIEDLVQNFVNAEDGNFSLFNYANLLNTQIEKLDSDIGDLKGEYESLRGGSVSAQGTISSDQGKQKLLGELEERWNRADKKAEHYELRFQQALKTLTAVRAGLQSIYNRLGCSQMAEHGALGLAGVTEANMLQYLGVIETRANEILLLHTALQEGDEEEAELPATREPMSQLQIKLPSTVEDYTDDEDEDEDDDTRPFTREELKLKTQRGLQRKQEKGLRKAHR
mmetsp:Transcript_17344/g.43176  ORF Transcript_17344/g.43176 Transcript_17344/m.43176 type:complete len:548 (-) Transcript_17344:870-2513(-)|eukprot:CAMPEP_0178997062 /NCGR_PEP_ID=MMETSP0795-20121207/8724_1 /TAXON_ID=88552 /ORGANISM="Amoebophrya sp., Strain Ameob2" /LENGTH=547 /DNA_ID=CAMNT_0020689539 /DNA_START=63 /DNA_END=1706 /DNA_ORIENTATION=-